MPRTRIYTRTGCTTTTSPTDRKFRKTLRAPIIIAPAPITRSPAPATNPDFRVGRGRYRATFFRETTAPNENGESTAEGGNQPRVGKMYRLLCQLLLYRTRLLSLFLYMLLFIVREYLGTAFNLQSREYRFVWEFEASGLFLFISSSFSFSTSKEKFRKRWPSDPRAWFEWSGLSMGNGRVSRRYNDR